jgi:hypothetical protein
MDNLAACIGFSLKFTRPTDFFFVDDDKLKNLFFLLVSCSGCSVRSLRHGKAILSLEKKNPAATQPRIIVVAHIKYYLRPKTEI